MLAARAAALTLEDGGGSGGFEVELIAGFIETGAIGRGGELGGEETVPLDGGGIGGGAGADKEGTRSGGREEGMLGGMGGAEVLVGVPADSLRYALTKSAFSAI